MAGGYKVEARLRLYASNAGGRIGSVHRPFKWRPICEFGTRPDGSPNHIGLCEVDLLDREELGPGEEGRVRFRFMEPVTPYLDTLGLGPGSRFGVWEGRVIGEAEVTAVEKPAS